MSAFTHLSRINLDLVFFFSIILVLADGIPQTFFSMPKQKGCDVVGPDCVAIRYKRFGLLKGSEISNILGDVYVQAQNGLQQYRE